MFVLTFVIFRQSTTQMIPSKTKSPISSFSQKLFAIGPDVSTSASHFHSDSQLTRIRYAGEFDENPVDLFPLSSHHLLKGSYAHVLH